MWRPCTPRSARAPRARRALLPPAPRVVEDHGAVLAADVGTLAVRRGGVVHAPEGLEEPLVGRALRIVDDGAPTPRVRCAQCTPRDRSAPSCCRPRSRPRTSITPGTHLKLASTPQSTPQQTSLRCLFGCLFGHLSSSWRRLARPSRAPSRRSSRHEGVFPQPNRAMRVRGDACEVGRATAVLRRAVIGARPPGHLRATGLVSASSRAASRMRPSCSAPPRGSPPVAQEGAPRGLVGGHRARLGREKAAVAAEGAHE